IKKGTQREMKNVAWGYHLLVDTSGCDLELMNDKDNIYKFVKQLIEDIDMVAHGEPIIEYLLPGDPKEGYSLMQLITTSNITAHFMKLDGTAYFDIFSCKPFDSIKAVNVIKQYFKPQQYVMNALTRKAP